MQQDVQKLRLLAALTAFIKDRFNLETDKADDHETIEYIKKGVEFKGANLWILIFAIFIASIGLNVNSTAVIIGAMLISPLMGPILGIGLGVGINDLELIKKALKNLGLATGISVITSTIYFSLSPLSDAQSELLARTTPTIWDVLIATFGGLAGIVAGSRKEKSNAIPGVAIATALMPPLCTAGYGIASGNWAYFFGAFYLYFINSVFITLSTFLIVRFLNYPKNTFVDHSVERRVKAAITFFAVITLIPSIYLGYNVVKRSIFERNVSNFITRELQFDNCRVISKQINYSVDPNRVEISLFGEQLSSEKIEGVKKKLVDYDLAKAELVIFQGYDASIDEAALESNIRTGIIEELYKQNQQLLESKDKRIVFLENEVFRLKQTSFISSEIAAELKTLYPNAREFSMNKSILTSMDSLKQDTVMLAYIKFARRPYNSELKKIQAWLSARLKSNDVKVIIQ
jgi:uncharacterized hydrophobic protein (TIGR00271 family)